MVSRPFQKLGGDSPHCDHSGDFVGDDEFNSYVSYVLILIETYSILVCTHIPIVPLPRSVINGKMEGSIRAQFF